MVVGTRIRYSIKKTFRRKATMQTIGNMMFQMQLQQAPAQIAGVHYYRAGDEAS